MILTVPNVGECGGLERTDFLHFLLCEGLVVLKEQIFKFLLWEGVVILKELFLTVSTLGECGVLKELIFNSFYFGQLLWS